jgi:hypothetical protein
MRSWSADELDRIGSAEELELASRRADGTLRPYATIWTVRSGDDIFVRSAHGYENPWFQRALHAGRGRVRAGGAEREVRFETPDPGAGDAVSRAYHAKYDSYGPNIVGTVVSPEAVK